MRPITNLAVLVTLVTACTDSDPVEVETSALADDGGEPIAVVCRAGDPPQPLGSCEGTLVRHRAEIRETEPAGGGVVSPDGRRVLVRDPSDIPPAPREQVPEEPPPPPPSPPPPDLSGYGHYCSMTWKTGGWAAAWDTTGNDPCGFIKKNADPGGTIERAGMFSATGYNRVTMRCADGTLYLYSGLGAGPLAAAFAAVAPPLPKKPLAGCIMTVAPVTLPIFGSPFIPHFGSDDELHSDVKPGTGLDFAQEQTGVNCPGCAYTITGAELGLGNLGPVTLVDYKGKLPPSNVSWANDHLGWDFGAPLNKRVYPVRAGKVLAARWYGAPPQCGPDLQGEVWILHTIHRVPSTYSEKFITSYIHGVPAAGLKAGDHVFKDDLIMLVNDTGCASGDHIHMDTIRVTNTSWHREIPFELYPAYNTPGGNGDNTNADPWEIDPAGWATFAAFDPWSWKTAKPAGALSISLWMPGTAPPLGIW